MTEQQTSAPTVHWNMWQSMPAFDGFPEDVDHNFVYYDSEGKSLYQYDYYTEIPLDDNHVTRGVWRIVAEL